MAKVYSNCFALISMLLFPFDGTSETKARVERNERTKKCRKSTPINGSICCTTNCMVILWARRCDDSKWCKWSPTIISKEWLQKAKTANWICGRQIAVVANSMCALLWAAFLVCQTASYASSKWWAQKIECAMLKLCGLHFLRYFRSRVHDSLAIE